MYSYSFTKQYNFEKLISELNGSGIFMDSIDMPDSTHFSINFSAQLSEQDEATMNTVVSNHNGTASVIIPNVTARQIRQALILSGITLAQIETAIEGLSEPHKSLAKVEWEYSNTFERNRPLVAQVAIMLGWTETQLDNLWLYAATL